MRRGPIIVLALIVFLTSYGVTSSAPVGKLPAKELKLDQIEILYTTSKEVQFPAITTKYVLWMEANVSGKEAYLKTMNLETKEIATLNETPFDFAFSYAPGIGTIIMNEYAVMDDEKQKTMNLVKLDGKETKVVAQKESASIYGSFAKGNKLYFHQTFKDDPDKTGLYCYDIDEANKPDDQEAKIPQPQFVFKTDEKRIVATGDYYFTGRVFQDKKISIYNSKFELIKTIEGFVFINSAGNHLIMTKRDKESKKLSWCCYDIKNDKFKTFNWPSYYSIYMENCAKNSDRIVTASIGDDRSKGLKIMAYFPETNKTYTLTERSGNMNNMWCATWDSLAVYPDQGGRYTTLTIFDATNQKKYIASDPTSGAIYPYIGGNSTFVWVQKSGLWGSDLCARKITMPDKK